MCGLVCLNILKAFRFLKI